MSGSPHPDGVKMLSCQFRALDEARQKIARLETVIETQERGIAEARASETQASEAIHRLMTEMDVASPGNFGYEGRLLWLLRELNVQAERYGRGHP